MAIQDVIESVFLPSANKAKQRQEDNKRLKCVQNGGVWDSVNKRCIMGEEPEPEPRAEPTKLTANQKVKGSFTTDPEGNEALVTRETQKAARLEGERMKAGVGAQELITNQQEQQRIQQRNAQLIQLAQQGLLTPDEINQIGGAGINIGQALGAGAIEGALIGGSAGLTVGAAAGLGVATPVTAPIGAGIGALFGFIKGMKSNLKSQQVGEFAADQTALTKGERYLRSLVTDTNQNPQNAPENIALFYQTLNLIDAAHARTFKDSQENLNKFLSNDGTQQLAKFETFDSTMRQYYISQFNTAVTQPDPARVLITNEDLGEVLE